MIAPKTPSVRPALPLLGGLIGLGGVVAMALRRRRRKRPALETLMAMDGPSFEAFIRGMGLKTASDIALTEG